jgi:hypothetical protein
MEADDANDFEHMQEALGDYASTPLGGAALKRAKPKEDTLDSFGA